MSKRGLGRGLDALLSNKKAPSSNAQDAKQVEVTERNELRQLPVEYLQPGQYQPRQAMTDEALEELAESIRSQGVIQPIIVRSVGTNKYEIIAGERRWRAAQLAELHEVPCLLKEIPDEAAIAMALIENIQREDLNAMEEAIALNRLMEEFGLTHQQTADAVGKSRTTVTNLLRLMSLAEECKKLLEHGDIDMGHARALLSLPTEQQAQAARTVVAKELNVRETEKLVRNWNQPKPSKKAVEKDHHIVSLEQSLADKLGAQVSIQHAAKGSGKLQIQYHSLDELQGILEHMGLESD